jgi:hypothetical protein
MSPKRESGVKCPPSFDRASKKLAERIAGEAAYRIHLVEDG